MKSADEIRQELFDIAEPVCEDAGYELVDIRYLREQSGWVVRAFIDRPEGISFADCERVSRELSAVLDVEDPIPHGYNLEVSSPGVDRPLRTAEHFRRFVGHTARIVLARDQDGRKRFKGTIIEVAPAEGDAGDDASVTIEIEDGQRFALPVADMASAKLVPEWDAPIGKSGPGASGGGAAPNAPAGVL